MNILGIIPARGGSKGIPRKNLADLAGKPLLAYTAEAALAARRLSRVFLSTDDEEIASMGRELGLECPFLRPPELARDDTPTIPVLQDVVRRIEAGGGRFDAIFTLQPTNPLRLSSDIDGAVELFEATNADSVIGFSEVGERHPARMKTIDSEGRVYDPEFVEQSEGQHRYELTPYYLRDGSVYLTRREVLMAKASLKGDDCRAWLIPRQRALNIDEPFDLFLCEKMMQLSYQQFPGRPAGENQ